MLIKVTNHCAMGCTHCMESSTIKGRHMPLELFDRALDCADQVEALARPFYPLILLSGGECTDHPDIEVLIEKVLARGLMPMVLSHGLWLADDEKRASLLRPEWKTVRFQITHDPRFYPTAPPRIDDERVLYIDSLTMMMPLGRFKGQRHPELPTHSGPISFNFRSMTHAFRDVRQAVMQLRVRALTGKSGHCSPSISANGDFVAGESNACFKVGTVDSTPEELTEAVLSMGSCNRCGLETGLSQAHKRAIGVSTLYAPGELGTAR